MRKNSLTISAISIVILTAAAALAEPDYGPKYWTPTEEVVTPHIKWVKPDAQGAMKVLFIVARLKMREVVELAQRMELQFTVFAVGSQKTGYEGFGSACPYDPDGVSDVSALTDDLKKKLESTYDLIVLGGVNWSTFPLVLRYGILKKVKEGTALVGVVKKPDDYFKRAMAKKEKLDLPGLVPYKGLPAFAKYKDAAEWLNATVDCAEFGKGKILTLKGFDIPPGLQLLTPGPSGNLLEPKLVEYDYYLAWIGHLIRFAVGRTAVLVTGIDYVFTNRSDLANMEYSISGPADKTVKCAFAFRNDDNQVVSSQEKEVRLSAGGTAVKFEVPRVPAGRYFGDVWVKESGKVWAFGSSFVELTGDPAIEAIELKADYRREEKVKGKIKVIARKLAEGGLVPAKTGLNLVLRQKDTYGRVTAESRIDVPALQSNVAQEVNFELSGPKALTIVQYLEVELQQGSEVLDRKAKAFSISNLPPKDDIRMIGMCGWQFRMIGGGNWQTYSWFAELAKAGFDTQYGTHQGCFSEIPPLFNIRPILYATRLIDHKSDRYSGMPLRTKDDHVRQPCLTDPGYRKELAELLTKGAETVKPFSVTEFSLGDECAFIDSRKGFELCFSPTCVAAFHKFLASEYQTVEAMNREYGVLYKSFDEVQPVTLDEAKKESKLQPLWVDYRRHMEGTWAGIFSYSAEVIRKVVPSAKIGYDGSDGELKSYAATDYYKLMKAMRLNNVYDGLFVPTAVMSFAQPGTLLGLGWYGGYSGGERVGRCPEGHRYIAWRHLFRGANSLWVFNPDPCFSESVMAPDLSLYDFFKANVAEVQEIKRGIGKLLMTSRRADDGIAILYSASSVHVSTLTKGLPDMEKVLNALTPLFEDTGRQFKIVSDEQVSDGELKKGGYKVLWMPYVQALSRKEAAEVEAFVRAGGAVIADLRPGVRDEHGKPYEGGGILDKVFGVKQRTEEPMAATNCEVKIELEGYAKTLKMAACDLSLAPADGKAKGTVAGGKPSVIVNQYGKGKAILLNCSLADYVGVVRSCYDNVVEDTAGSGDMRELFKTVMMQVGVEDSVKVEPEIRGALLYRFANGDNGYLGVLQELPESFMAYTEGKANPLIATSAVLKLSGKKHVYDARQGKYLGYTDRIETRIEPAKALLFALLPYEVKSLKAGASKRIKQGGTLEYELAVQGVERPGLHVFHVDLVSPRGETVAYYAENVVGENGKCKGLVSLALNEAVGKWKIRVRDVATGTTAEQVFSVEEWNQK